MLMAIILIEQLNLVVLYFFLSFLSYLLQVDLEPELSINNINKNLELVEDFFLHIMSHHEKLLNDFFVEGFSC